MGILAGNAWDIPKEGAQHTGLLTSYQSSTSESICSIDPVLVRGQSYIKDHRVIGNIIYPAAAFCIAGSKVHQALGGSRNKQRAITLKNLKFRRALLLLPNDSKVLCLSYDSLQNKFAVHTQADDEPFGSTLHTSGSLAHTNVCSPDCQIKVDEILDRCRESLDVADFYQRLHRSGLEYGPYFQRIHCLQVSRSTNEVVARLIAHPDLIADRDPWAHSVTLLDSAFQSLAATLDIDGSELFVPMRIKELHIYGDFYSDLWCYAQKVNSNARTVTGDIRLIDTNGRKIAEIKGLQCLRKPRAPATDGNDSLLHKHSKESNYCCR